MKSVKKVKSNINIYKNELKEKGINYLIGKRVEKLQTFYYLYYKRFLKKNYFLFQGKKYEYFYNTYNFTWMNERAVEISLIWDEVKKHRRKNILEIGNVLSHYVLVTHTIVDKYEEANEVINKDVVSFKSAEKYDLIVSISTLEHVGWDEKPREHFKILPSVKNLKRLLKPHGKIFLTLPIGYNHDIDLLLKQKKLPFDACYYMKRLTRSNEWTESTWKEVKDLVYNSPFPNANGIIIGIIEK